MPRSKSKSIGKKTTGKNPDERTFELASPTDAMGQELP
jgi:hypothetical protein